MWCGDEFCLHLTRVESPYMYVGGSGPAIFWVESDPTWVLVPIEGCFFLYVQFNVKWAFIDGEYSE